jgi:tRNA(Ile)-lysidine synthase
MPALPKGYRHFIRTVEDTISAHNMFQPQDSVLVGVSGGPDSVALLHALLEIAPGFPLKLAVAHLNHGLRQEESENEAKFVISLAETLGLPCHLEKKDVLKFQRSHRISIEEAARRVRYRFFKDLVVKYKFDKIALGHHGDDNAELILMHLFRGSGPLGISGIPPVRERQIVRPLIRLSKSEIMEFLTARGIHYVYDASNKDLRHFRNKIRHLLLPDLKKNYNPKISEILNRLAAITNNEEEWIESLIKPIFDRSIINQETDRIDLSVSEINQIHIAAKKRIFRKAIKVVKGNLRRITFSHINSMVRLVESGPRFGSLDLPEGIRISRRDLMIRIAKDKRNGRKRVSSKIRPDMEHFSSEKLSFEYYISEPGAFYIKEIGVRMQFSETPLLPLSDMGLSGHRVAFFDMEKIRFPLVVRNILPGDRFTPLGMTGTQKLKKFFINNKVSRIERSTCPVVLSKEKIIWVAGHRIDDGVKVTPSTRHVLKGELFLA